MRKFVRTPPMSTATRGLAREPVLQHADVGGGAADVDDRAVLAARRNAAPRIEFVGPEANVATGKRSA